MSSSVTWPCAALAEAELAPRTTMRVGGRAEWLLEPADPEELRRAWIHAREQGSEVRLLGGGANLIVEDGLHPGVVISTARLRRVFRPDLAEEAMGGAPGEKLERGAPAQLVAWAGATLPSLVNAATRLGWSGLEGLVGVPGQLGGGLAMNAGGRWGDLWNVVESVRLLEADGELVDLPRERCTPRYRDGGLGERVAVGAVLRLVAADPEQVRERAREYLLEKKRVQPVTESSSGCIFKNPDRELSDGRSAGKLIEDCGCKGLARGDAIVSPLHANFIVNRGRASASDVLGLIDEVRERVAQRTGIELATEVRIWRRLEGESTRS
jgi:UDP-N-acetylenolpyruvoylglucosamine reductase